MRGALATDWMWAVAIGIIPADAGSTSIWMFRWAKVKDHPRGCGEHPDSLIHHGRDGGSSPRMRGARARFC